MENNKMEVFIKFDKDKNISISSEENNININYEEKNINAKEIIQLLDYEDKKGYEINVSIDESITSKTDLDYFEEVKKLFTSIITELNDLSKYKDDENVKMVNNNSAQNELDIQNEK